ncbi:MAG TPA: dual specificity protein phosphatase family protein [Dehalococcoidia bacterium]|nr:dual specificity protein phosphatase family protein [Dehalococcoidia bacterium]
MTLLRRLLGLPRAALDIAWLTTDLAIASAPKDHEWQAVKDSGIRAVLDLRAEGYDHSLLAEGTHGLRYLRLPVMEYEAPSDAELRLVTDWAVERMGAGEPVLVHCREGRGRSAMVACAILIRLGVPLKEAYQMLVNARPHVSLSKSQEALLQHFAETVS